MCKSWQSDKLFQCVNIFIEILELFLYLERAFIRNFLKNKTYNLKVNFVSWKGNGSYGIFIYTYYFSLFFLLPQTPFPLLSSLISLPKHSLFVVACPMYPSPLLPPLHHMISCFPFIIPSTSITYTCVNTHVKAQALMWVYVYMQHTMYMHAHTHTHSMYTYKCLQSSKNANTSVHIYWHT